MFDEIVHYIGLGFFASAWILVGGWAVHAVFRATAGLRARARLPRSTLDPRMTPVRREKPVLSVAA